MASFRYLGVALVCGVAMMGACGDETDDPGSPTTTGGGATTSGTGGTGGSTTTTSTSSSGMACNTTNLGLTCTGTVSDVDQSACSLLSQYCPDGQWCDISDNGSRCVPYQGGSKGHGTACGNDSECLAGLSCIGNKCSAFCCDATDQPCCGGTCSTTVDFGNGVRAMMCAYQDACDLLLDNCPIPGEDCHPADVAAGQALCTAPASSAVPEGGTCMFVNDCGESQLCNQNLGDDQICRQLCNVNSWMTDAVPTGGCLQGRECVSVNWNNGGVWDHIGLCMPPGGSGGSGGN